MKTNQSLTTTNFIGYAQEEYENLKPLIEITKAFVRSSNQYIPKIRKQSQWQSQLQ